MVIGKLKYLMEPAMEHTPHCLVFGHTRVQGTLGQWACFMPGEKGVKVAWVIAFPMRVFRSAWPG